MFRWVRKILNPFLLIGAALLIITYTRNKIVKPLSSVNPYYKTFEKVKTTCLAPVPYGAEMNETWPWPVDQLQLRSLRTAIDRVATCRPNVSNYSTVFIVLIDSGFDEMLDSFLFSLRRKANIDKILFVTLDKTLHFDLTRRGLVSFLSEDLGQFGKEEVIQFSEGYYRKGQYKFKIATMILNLHYSVVVTDLDITYLKNPFKCLQNPTYDVAIQKDFMPKGTTLNAGLVHIRPTVRAISFFRAYSRYLETHQNVWDQALLNQMLYRESKRGKLIMKTLDYKDFVPGIINDECNYMYYAPMGELLNTMHTLHHIISDYKGKIYRMKEFGVWMHDVHGYYSNPNQKYLTYENPIKALREDEFAVLENALRIAKLAGRILILPKFHCRRKRACPASIFGIHHKDDHCYCSLVHLLQDQIGKCDQTLITKFYKKHQEGFRESTFLSHSFVPEKIKQSLSPLILMNTDAVIKNGAALIYDSVLLFSPKNTTTGPSKHNILTWMKPFNSFAVVRFKALYGKFNFN